MGVQLNELISVDQKLAQIIELAVSEDYYSECEYLSLKRSRLHKHKIIYLLKCSWLLSVAYPSNLYQSETIPASEV